MALDLAIDTETIQGIVKVIPEAEGDDFAALKQEAILKLNAMQNKLKSESVGSGHDFREVKTLHANRRDDLFKRIAEKI